jgi:hypothetical protein
MVSVSPLVAVRRVVHTINFKSLSFCILRQPILVLFSIILMVPSPYTVYDEHNKKQKKKRSLGSG